MVSESWGIPEVIEAHGDRRLHLTLSLRGSGWQKQNGVRVFVGADVEAEADALAAARWLLLEWAAAVITREGLQ